MSLGTNQRKLLKRPAFKHLPRAPRGGLAWTLALLAPLTTLALAIVSPWLVAPYLIVLAWLVFAPAPKTKERSIPPRVSPTQTQEESTVEETGAGLEETAQTFDESTATTNVAPTPKSRRGKAKGRTRVLKAVPEPAHVAWVKVGPNKFVRVEKPGDSTLEFTPPRNNPSTDDPIVEPNVEDRARGGDFEDLLAREEPPAAEDLANPATSFGEVDESAIRIEARSAETEPRTAIDESARIGETPDIGAGFADARFDESDAGPFETSRPLEVVGDALVSNVRFEPESCLGDPIAETTEAEAFDRRDESSSAFPEDRPAIDAKAPENVLDFEDSFASSVSTDENTAGSATFDDFANDLEVAVVADNASDTSANPPLEESASESDVEAPADVKPIEAAFVASDSFESEPLLRQLSRRRSRSSQGTRAIRSASRRFAFPARARKARAPRLIGSARVRLSVRSRPRLRAARFDRSQSHRRRFFPRAPPHPRAVAADRRSNRDDPARKADRQPRQSM